MLMSRSRTTELLTKQLATSMADIAAFMEKTELEVGLDSTVSLKPVANMRRIARSRPDRVRGNRSITELCTQFG